MKNNQLFQENFSKVSLVVPLGITAQLTHSQLLRHMLKEKIAFEGTLKIL
jgi:hypothetical protein